MSFFFQEMEKIKSIKSGKSVRFEVIAGLFYDDYSNAQNFCFIACISLINRHLFSLQIIQILMKSFRKCPVGVDGYRETNEASEKGRLNNVNRIKCT
jgi:hypothetical protein